jgi:hypothetical protein
MAHPRHAALPRVEDNAKRDLDVLLAMLIRADIGFVLNQGGNVTTVELIVELPTAPKRARPVFTFTKAGGAMRSLAMEGVTDL